MNHPFSLHTFYFLSATLGCSFVLLQFLLMLVFGLGGEDDYGSSGSDLGDTGGDVGDASVETESGGDLDSDGAGHGVHAHSSIDFLKMVSIRTVTAGLGFFGLAGLAAESAGLNGAFSFFIALLAGFTAFTLVYFLYRFISSFRYNGSISNSTLVDCSGIVHVRIPAFRQGSGKVIVTQQERTMEYEAVSDSAEMLKAGTPIVVTEVLAGSLVLVTPK